MLRYGFYTACTVAASVARKCCSSRRPTSPQTSAPVSRSWVAEMLPLARGFGCRFQLRSHCWQRIVLICCTFGQLTVSTGLVMAIENGRGHRCAKTIVAPVGPEASYKLGEARRPRCQYQVTVGSRNASVALEVLSSMPSEVLQAFELGRGDYVTGEMWKRETHIPSALWTVVAPAEIAWHYKHYPGRGVITVL